MIRLIKRHTVEDNGRRLIPDDEKVTVRCEVCGRGIVTTAGHIRKGIRHGWACKECRSGDK